MTTRANLVADVASWMLRDDLEPQAGTFIRLVESWIDRTVRVPQQQTIATTLTVTDRVTPFPADMLEMVTLTLPGKDTASIYRPSETLRAETDDDVGYTVEGMSLVLASTPIMPLDFDLVYIAKFARLVDDNDTNWLLTNAYDIYLYRMLSVAAEFVVETESQMQYLQQAMMAVDELHKSEHRAGFSNVVRAKVYTPPRRLI